MNQGTSADIGQAPAAGETGTDQTVESLRDILRVIDRSQDDETPVLEMIVRTAARLCNSPDVGLHLVNEARTHSRLVCVSQGDRGIFEIGQEFDLNDPHQTPTAIREGRVIHNPDIADDPLYRAGDPIRVKLVDVDGVRSRLSVPLLRDGTAFGCINLNRHEVRPFTDAEIALIETFAAQAVIAIENVRQFRKLQSRLDREAATREILQVISRSRTNAQPVFHVILENAARLCSAPHALILMRNAANTHLELVASNSAESAFVDQLRVSPHALSNTVSLAVQTVESASARHIADITQLPDIDENPQLQMAVNVEGMRSVLTLPLEKDGHALGALCLYKLEVAPFSEDEIELMRTFAAQAVIAIENVRQFLELQARLGREAASREILQVISQSRDDEIPVFETILENASRLCKAPLAFLGLVNDDRTHVTVPAVRGARSEFADILENFREPIERSELVAVYPVATGDVTRIDDMKDTDLYRAGDPRRLQMVDVEGVRSVLAVPLLRDGTGIGSLVLYRREVAPFSDDDLGLVQSFAAQAVIAIENVRQFRELQTRLEREEASRQILGVISSSRDDEQPVFDTILRNASRLCGGQDARLMLADEARENFVFTAVHGDELLAAKIGQTFPLARPYRIAETILTGKTIIILDMMDTDAYRAGVPAYVKLVDVEGLRTRLIVPLMHGDVAIGCIVLSRREVRTFSDDEIALIETFAAQAVIAIENVRQFRALEALNAELGDRVEEQVGEIERMGRLKRFLSPAVADVVVSTGEEKILGSHRALISVLFCDIRGFTAFCETAEPEETIEVLQQYHEEMGVLLSRFGVGVDHRSGDGIMAIFNDPLPCEDPAGDALRMALAMRARMEELCTGWKRLGHRLGFGVGISLGYATVGMVGSEGRFEYTASGTTVNLAARLCDEAADGEILLSPRAFTAVEDDFEAAPHGDLSLKGIAAPVAVYRVTGPKEAA